MLQAFQEFRLDHIFREGNKTTDALAKRDYNKLEDLVYF